MFTVDGGAGQGRQRAAGGRVRAMLTPKPDARDSGTPHRATAASASARCAPAPRWAGRTSDARTQLSEAR